MSGTISPKIWGMGKSQACGCDMSGYQESLRSGQVGVAHSVVYIVSGLDWIAIDLVMVGIRVCELAIKFYIYGQ